MIPTLSAKLIRISTCAHVTEPVTGHQPKTFAKQWHTCAMALAFLFSLITALPAQAQQFQLLFQFPLRKTGSNPSGLLRVNGNFYGTTTLGGMSNEGTVFELTSEGALTSLYSFNRNTSDGRTPTVGPLLRDRAGNLYGTTEAGGDLKCVSVNPSQKGCGTVFKLSPEGKETILHSFNGSPSDGATPLAGLTADSAGNLYGTTYVGGSGCTDGAGGGCGTVFKITPAGVETVLYSFSGGADGSTPDYVNLLIDSAGNLYGTTLRGGDLNCPGSSREGCGVVFKIDATGQETVLYAFTGGVTGGYPQAGLARDSLGNLYGTATAGGNTCPLCDLIYKVDPAGNETVLYLFSSEEIGGTQSPLLLDAAGNLYGTTPYGGAFQQGNVFELTSQGVYTSLHDFEETDGLYPEAGLVRDNAGNLYGTTLQGGTFSCSNGCGVIFEITP
jgi:uncharacterized repeat protein (TIGR03803 family)